MWTRRQIKEKGKYTFKANYWKTVLICLLVLLLAGGGVNNGISSASKLTDHSDSEVDSYYDSSDEEILDESDSELEYAPESAWAEENDVTDDELAAAEEMLNDDFFTDASSSSSVGVIFFLILWFLIALVILGAIALVKALLVNPLKVGTARFFLVNLKEQAQIKEIGFGFDHNFKTNAITLLLRDIFVLLWTLLLIIPGIVKSYEYRMIPFILADHPEISRKEAFILSRQLMKGNKWKSFVLDLSFIGWRLLAMLTLGILNIFYVNPYVNMTDAALYEALCYEQKSKIQNMTQEAGNVPAEI